MTWAEKQARQIIEMHRKMGVRGHEPKDPIASIWAAVIYGRDSLKRPLTGKKQIQCYDAIVRYWRRLQNAHN
jgi:hypothetical protein